jgi:hypothetical protein
LRSILTGLTLKRPGGDYLRFSQYYRPKTIDTIRQDAAKFSHSFHQARAALLPLTKSFQQNPCTTQSELPRLETQM